MSVPDDELEALHAQVDNLQRAIESRAVIEQAKGMIMMTMRCTADQAFEVLRSQSQTENVKLRDVAEALVRMHTTRPMDGKKPVEPR
jgi:AmiR/NasT family two-component response regulator